MPDDIYSLSDNTALYTLLGVAKTATANEIKKAYHKLAIQYHPDKNPAGADKFKEISFAYNVLSDPDQRKMYDSQTLKKRIATEARQRDPAMDPNVELEGEDLRSFVEKLHGEQMERLRKKAEFERRREEEYRRRAEFDAANPNFRMPPDTPLSTASSSSSASYQASSPFLQEALRSAVPGRTSADMLASLHAKLNQQQQQQENADPSSPSSSSSNYPQPSFAAKQAMMSKFRVSREAVGVAPAVVDAKTKATLQSAAQSSKYEFVKEHSKNAYDYDIERIKRRAGFDYQDFIVKQFHDGGVVKEAILADALGKYDPTKQGAGVD